MYSTKTHTPYMVGLHRAKHIRYIVHCYNERAYWPQFALFVNISHVYK